MYRIAVTLKNRSWTLAFRYRWYSRPILATARLLITVGSLKTGERTAVIIESYSIIQHSNQ